VFLWLCVRGGDCRERVGECARCRCCVTFDRKVRLFKSSYRVEPLVGVPYGSVFEVRRSKLERVDGKLALELEMPTVATGGEMDGGDDADVAGTIATATAAAAAGDASASAAAGAVAAPQPGDTSDIRELWSGGASSTEIVAAVAGNCATFAQKTKFSQQKYIQRKTSK
jgi:hypothetical protein